MTLEQLKRIVNKAYGIDLTTNSRRNEYKIPRFVFCHYARKYLMNAKGKVITFDEIAIFLDKNHATITNAIKGYPNLMSYYPDASLISELIEIKIKKKLGIEPTEKEIKILENKNVELRQIDLDVLKAIKNINDSDILELLETRIKPFKNMLKSKVLHNVQEVRGAHRSFSIN